MANADDRNVDYESKREESDSRSNKIKFKKTFNVRTASNDVPTVRLRIPLFFSSRPLSPLSQLRGDVEQVIGFANVSVVISLVKTQPTRFTSLSPDANS